jgi:hypothetical protein
MAKDNRQASESDLLAAINDKLSQLLIVTALAYVSGKERQTAIESLAAAGLTGEAISELTGWPRTSVSPVVSRFRARKGKGN